MIIEQSIGIFLNGHVTLMCIWIYIIDFLTFLKNFECCLHINHNGTRPLWGCYRRLSRLMKPNLVKNIQELSKSPTRSIIANYEKCRTLHEYNRNLRSITRCDKSTARILDNPKTIPEFFLNLYIINILDKFIKIMYKNYRFMYEILKTIIYWNFTIIIYLL